MSPFPLAAQILLSKVCDAHNHTVHDAEQVLHIVSLTILIIFLVQQCLLMFGLGVCVYLRHLWYVLDLIVIVAALFLENFAQNVAGDAASMVIIVMAWRAVRIVHGFAMAELETHTQVVMARHERSMREAEIAAAAKITAGEMASVTTPGGSVRVAELEIA